MFDGEHFTRRINELLDARAGSYRAEAKRLGMSPPVLYNYRIGVRTPLAEGVRKICKGYGVTANDLLNVHWIGEPECESTAFSDRLKVAMDAAGKYAEITAKAAGIQPQAMTFYLHGRTEPGAFALVGLCDTLEVSADWLLGIDKEVGE